MTRKSRKRKKQKRRGAGERVAVFLMGTLLTVCVVSAALGFFNRRAGAVNTPQDLIIEVLNGTGAAGLAQATAVALMRRGVDVLKVTNADSFDYEESVLIAHKKPREIENLAEALGCSTVIEEADENSLIDATFILGGDYENLNLGIESGLKE